MGTDMNSTTANYSFVHCLNESEITFWVTNFQEKIRPVASVNPIVVNQTGLAFLSSWFTMCTLHVVSGAFGSVRVQPELVFAPRSTYRCNWNEQRTLANNTLNQFSRRSTYDQPSVVRSLRPSGNCSGCEPILYRRKASHSRIVPRLGSRWCTGRKDCRIPDGRRLGLRAGPGRPEHLGPKRLRELDHKTCY